MSRNTRIGRPKNLGPVAESTLPGVNFVHRRGAYGGHQLHFMLVHGVTVRLAEVFNEVARAGSRVPRAEMAEPLPSMLLHLVNGPSLSVFEHDHTAIVKSA